MARDVPPYLYDKKEFTGIGQLISRRGSSLLSAHYRSFMFVSLMDNRLWTNDAEARSDPLR